MLPVGFSRQVLWRAQRQQPTSGQGELSQQRFRRDVIYLADIVCRREAPNMRFFTGTAWGSRGQPCGGWSTMGQKLSDTTKIGPLFRNGQFGVRSYRFTAWCVRQCGAACAVQTSQPGRGGMMPVGFRRQVLWRAQRQQPTSGQGELSQQRFRRDVIYLAEIVCRREAPNMRFSTGTTWGNRGQMWGVVHDGPKVVRRNKDWATFS